MIIILFHLQMISILYITYRTVRSPTRSIQCQSLCQQFTIPMLIIILLYNGFNINIFLYSECISSYDSQHFHVLSIKCACAIKYHVGWLMKMASDLRPNFVVVETVFFHSIWRSSCYFKTRILLWMWLELC